MVMGTVAYMSPEQARGEQLDTRTDLFSFGVVLYEMATGTAPFRGNSTTLILDAILHASPVPVRQLRPELPAALEQITGATLEKDRELRYQTASELRAALLRLKRDAQAGTAADTAANVVAGALAGAKPSKVTRRTAIGALAGAAAGAAGVGAFGLSRWRGATPRNLTRFSIPLPEGAVAEASANKRVAISPDGTRVAYSVSVAGQGQSPAANKLYLRSLSELEPKLLPIAGGVPFFSPDGRWLGFLVGPPPQIRKVGLGGGAPVTLCTVEGPAGATWADDDAIYLVAAMPGGVMRVPAAGGQPQEVAKIDFAKGERMHKYPCAIPGSKAVLFTVTTTDVETFDDTHIAVLDTKTGQQKTLVEGGTHPRYSPSSHLVYAHGGNLLAVRFDPKRLETSGQPFTVLEGRGHEREQRGCELRHLGQRRSHLCSRGGG